VLISELRTFEWRTTCPSGKSHTHGADDGQTGWRLHLVDLSKQRQEKRYTRWGPEQFVRGPALCGMTPRMGWGLDLFIDAPCERCVRIAEKRGIEIPTIPK
jgi:hypothetical protein